MTSSRANAMTPAAPPAIGALPTPNASAEEVLANLQRLLAARRERIATAALQGLLASCGNVQTNRPSAEHLAARSVHYADALIDALNKVTKEAAHARPR
jgi:hypothetical protein